MEKRDKAILTGVILLALVLLYWSVSTSINSNKAKVNEETGIVSEIPEHSEETFAKAMESEIKEDPCAIPEGYTDEAWREHMSHHPDQYKDCL